MGNLSNGAFIMQQQMKVESDVQFPIKKQLDRVATFIVVRPWIKK